jgi:O-succinylbenzoic acid--CoA ligase
MRELIRVGASDYDAFRVQLEAALRGRGPAILPVTDGRVGLEGYVHDDVALVIETSGSSGVPKQVALSASALLASARACHGRLGGLGQWLLALPLNYVAGAQVVVRSLDADIEPATLGSGPFTPESFVRAASAMQQGRKYSSLVPAQLSRLVEYAESSGSAREELASFDALLIGGQAAPVQLINRATALGLSVVTTYGATETSGGCVYDGIALEGVHVSTDAEGQVLISGDILATEYISGAPATESFSEIDGRRTYSTGDIGRLESGRLIIQGRSDRVLISGGIKVSLDAIEACVTQAQYPVSVAVAVASEAWGQRPILVVEGTGEGHSERELEAIVLEQLGKVAVPDRIVWVAELPRLASGKPDLVAIAALVTQ